MKNYKAYRITVLILSLAIIFETVLLISLWITRPKKKPEIAKIPVAIKAKIAIVIDDWGYNTHNLALIEQIKYPLTVSILPNLAYSQTIASELHKLGFELILHLPLEPREKFRLEKNTITISMSEPTVKKILTQDLDSIAHIKGVSNHMGSRATEDERTMNAIFKELKKRNLYFLDSLVSSNSVCVNLAKKMKVLFAQRDVFLDNLENSEYKQLYNLKNRAEVYGYAIGIGHDRKVTLETLKQVMPEIEKEGYKFVFVSDLVR